MTSLTQQPDGYPNTHHEADQPDQRTRANKEAEDEESDIKEIPREPDLGQDVPPATNIGSATGSGPRGNPPSPPRPRSPAYVAPIPKIGRIPPVSSPASRPQLPPGIGDLLVGKRVDEYGDIVDDKTGRAVARAGGDLPAIVGRTVSNNRGDILGDDGELLGYVADVPEVGGPGAANRKPRSLFEVLGHTAGLMLDHQGNILDAGGNVVGRFHDNNNPLHRKEKEEREARGERKNPEGIAAVPENRPEGQQQQQRAGAGAEAEAQANYEDGSRREQEEEDDDGNDQEPTREERGREQQQQEEQERRSSRRPESERRRNAESWRKENPGESPSDIFLDVKSTTEGIQLTIRIPTVFNGQQVRSNVSFS